jgi:alkanesulfonate monooxygenase SsuD/methylene tetrahydromethanopterin reductase-like flavin-dependent oxidoreductase (luciferase family)
VVTGYLNSAAKGIGLARQPEHDTRYEIAEEYMQVVRTQRVFARPEKVHRIRHDGRYFQIEAIHLCEPSPQRTTADLSGRRVFLRGKILAPFGVYPL